ncbi:TolB family protein [Cryptosporangium sp. NPDC048952]|uniref:TolB family protein n=1 Tax=Cryptosporangium sp. NPDC048952 TaxID=3363961 RepID=UPI00371B7BEB
MKFLRTLVALAITVCVALLAVAIAGYGSSQNMGDDAKVPAEVFEPFGWQASVTKSAPGPATVLVSGDGWGMQGPVYTKVAVVAESGVYRMLRYKTDVQTGEDVLLSPDGGEVADALPHQIVGPSGSPTTPPKSVEPEIWITDLVTGKSTRSTVPGTGSARPIAWSPDGRKLLVQVAAAPDHGPWVGGDLNLLDVESGDVRRLAGLGSEPVNRANLAAFSPNGNRVAVQVGDALQVIDLRNRTTRTLTRLGADRRLAGIGAWSPSGDRIAVLTLSGCTKLCTRDALDDRTWQIDEIDAQSGSPSVGGFERVTGSAVRVLGRTDDGELAVVRYRPAEDLSSDTQGTLFVDGDVVEDTDYAAVGDVELLGLDASGDRRTLIELPPGSRHVDVAADLVNDDRFDGRSSRPTPFPAPFWVNALAVLVLVLVVWFALKVRRRARA